VAGNPDHDVVFRHTAGRRGYGVASRAIREAIDGRSVQSPEAITLIRRLVREGESMVAGGHA
jgi:hypothetical protein